MSIFFQAILLWECVCCVIFIEVFNLIRDMYLLWKKQTKRLLIYFTCKKTCLKFWHTPFCTNYFAGSLAQTFPQTFSQFHTLLNTLLQALSNIPSYIFQRTFTHTLKKISRTIYWIFLHATFKTIFQGNFYQILSKIKFWL